MTFVTSGSAADCAPAAAGCRELVRADGTGWLADGFLEGQRVRVCHDRHHDLRRLQDRAHPRHERDEGREDAVHVRGRRSGRFTRHAERHRHADRRGRHVHAAPRPTRTRGSSSRRSSCRPTRSTRRRRAATTSRSSRSRRTCSRSCAARWPSRAARPPPTGRCATASSSPARRDAALFEIPAQAPESSQIDVLNVFNDSSQSDGVGHDDVDDADRVRDVEGPHVRRHGPRSASRRRSRAGSASATIDVRRHGQFVRPTARKSTIEVLNVLLGQGNDRLTITGTLDPARPSADTPVTFIGRAAASTPTGCDARPLRGSVRSLDGRADRRRRHVVHAHAARRHELGDRLRRATSSSASRSLISGVDGVFRVVAVSGSVLTLEKGAGRGVRRLALTRRRTSSRPSRCPARTAG